MVIVLLIIFFFVVIDGNYGWVVVRLGKMFGMFVKIFVFVNMDVNIIVDIKSEGVEVINIGKLYDDVIFEVVRGLDIEKGILI